MGSSQNDLFMRPAIKADSHRLLRWSNHVSARQYSRNSEVIDPDVHEEWFDKRLSPTESESRILIFMCSDMFIGMTRIDSLGEGSGEISIVVDPALQGKGFGSKVLRQSIEYAFVEMKYFELLASIHTGNSASISLFSKFGFQRVHKEGMFETYKLSN